MLSSKGDAFRDLRWLGLLGRDHAGSDVVYDDELSSSPGPLSQWRLQPALLTLGPVGAGSDGDGCNLSPLSRLLPAHRQRSRHIRISLSTYASEDGGIVNQLTFRQQCGVD